MGLRVTFLGTAGAIPTVRRNPSAVAVSREGETWLFDCGEGTQRQMMRFGTGFSISRLFVTHAHGDHVLGIPGLLQTMDFNDRTDPLTISVPTGTARMVRSVAFTLDTTPSFPIHLEEVGDGDVVHRGEEYEIRAFETDHDTRSVGYALIEEDRKGRFDRERAEELGVPVGPKFSTLHGGEAVELDDGSVVRPDQVVGAPRPGRTVVYTGDTRPADRTAEVAGGADLLIHDATFADDRAERAADTAHSTAREAGSVASRADARRLALVHLSSRYAGNPSAHLKEAREAFDGDVTLPEDGDEIDVLYPDAV